jgi:hypothetical protein
VQHGKQACCRQLNFEPTPTHNIGVSYKDREGVVISTPCTEILDQVALQQHGQQVLEKLEVCMVQLEMNPTKVQNAVQCPALGKGCAQDKDSAGGGGGDARVDEKTPTAFETKVLEQLVFQQEVLRKLADRIFLVERMLCFAPVKLNTQMPAAGVEPETQGAQNVQHPDAHAWSSALTAGTFP